MAPGSGDVIETSSRGRRGHARAGEQLERDDEALDLGQVLDRVQDPALPATEQPDPNQPGDDGSEADGRGAERRADDEAGQPADQASQDDQPGGDREHAAQDDEGQRSPGDDGERAADANEGIVRRVPCGAGR